mgnify:CR=1 FL=1
MKVFFTEENLFLGIINQISNLKNTIMKELSVENMEKMKGGVCQSDSLNFLAGATVMGTVLGGGLGFVGGLIIGEIGALYITYNGEAC